MEGGFGGGGGQGQDLIDHVDKPTSKLLMLQKCVIFWFGEIICCQLC